MARIGLGNVYSDMVGEPVSNMRRDVDRARRDLTGLFGPLTLKPDPSNSFWWLRDGFDLAV